MGKRINWVVFTLVIISFGFCGPVSADVIDKIIAIVNADIITQVQLNKEITPFIKKIESSGYSSEKQNEMLQDVRKKILDTLIDNSLTQQEARRYRIKVSDAEIDNAVEHVKKSRSLSQEDLEKALENEGMTLDEYRGVIEKQILQNKLVNYMVKSKVIITESEIKKQYEADAEKYAGKKKFHLRNILMDNENKIKEVKKKLDQNKDFITLAKQYSIAPNASDGGDLGLFDISGFSKEIKDSISPLTKGDYTPVILTAQGFQIFYIQDIVMDGGKPYAEVHDMIYESLYRDQVEKKFDTWLKSLKEKAHIKILL